jgi:uncharacterized protein YidB (DUF937 family)
VGLLDGVLGGLMGGGKGGMEQKLLGAVMGMVGGGGLGSLMNNFQSGGLKEKADSWVGTGENQELTPDEVHEALGQEQVAKIAEEAGVSHEEAKTGLAAMLPGLIDKLSPDGKMPDLSQLQGLLKGFGK